MEKYCEEFNSLSEDVILDIIKRERPHGREAGEPDHPRHEWQADYRTYREQQLLVKAFENNDLVFATGPAGFGQNIRRYRPSRKSIKE